ncbi:MAG: hypothetical protein U0528_01670 [Anaerolineae bacterium]
MVSMELTSIRVLAAVRPSATTRFQDGLSTEAHLKATVVSSLEAATSYLNDHDDTTDVFVVDSGLGDVYNLIKEVRQQYPALLIILVDEESDFAMPGRADDVTTEPFKEGDLIKKIKRVAEERRLATLPAGALPEVRNFAKALRKATKAPAKQQAAIAAIKDLGFDYVAYFSINPGDPPTLSLGAQAGPPNITSLMPPRADTTTIIGSVAQAGKSRVIVAGDQPSHFLIDKGKFGTAVCVPVGSTMRLGVMFACRQEPGSIKQDSALMVELICAQLAAALAKDMRI